MESHVSKHFSLIPFTSILCHSSPKISKSLFDEVLSPLPRSGHRMVCVGHNLYLFGGYNPNLDKEHCDPYWQRTNPLFAELWQYNTVSNQWRSFYQCYMSRSDGLVSFGCAVSGYTMFHLGGTGAPFGQCSHNKVQACDLNSGVWQELGTNGELPLPAYGQGVVLDDNDMYVVGGTTGYEYSLDVHHINVVEKKWSKLNKADSGQNFPMPRYRHEIVVYEGELLVIGGGQKEVTASLDMLAAFSLAERVWRYHTTQPDPASQLYPAPRKCHITVHHGNCEWGVPHYT